MAQCKFILSSALHGLICADSLNIPNKHIILGNDVIGGEYKFKDYYSVFKDVDYHPVYLKDTIITDSDIWKYQSEYTITTKEIESICENLIRAFPKNLTKHYKQFIKKNNIPKVSVVLPVYNVAPYLDRCISSLLVQTLKDVEFIFVDDCSTDNSSDIIKSYADPRIKLIRHSVNKYTAEARNTGIANAKGEYIAFVDPDDYIDNNFLLDLYVLAKQTNADIVKGIHKKIPSNNIVNNNDKIRKNKYMFSSAMWSAIYKRKLFNKHNIRFYVDCMVGHFLLVHFAKKIVTTDKAVYNYVTHEGSCVNSEFIPEKWKKLNVRGANLLLEFINKLDLKHEDYNIVLNHILSLYQYGYYRMNLKNQQEYRDELKAYLDNLYKSAKYKDDESFLLQYSQAQEKLNTF